jgi:flagellar assembly protein FliH
MSLEKFTFDTEFDAGGGVAFQAPRPKRTFTADEAEQLRQQAFAEGQAQAMASIAAQQAQAMSVIAAACAQALPKLAEVAHEHRTGSAVLALACARGIADAALDRFPEAPVQAALAALAREIEAQPRLVVTAEPQLCEAVQGVLDDTARAIGFEGGIVVKAEPGFGRHAFTLDFGDGAATFDPAQAALRVTEALEAALAAEGLHAEPLIPGSES